MSIHPSRHGVFDYLAFAFIAAVLISGFFFPLVGLVVPIMMLVAVVMNAVKPRWFCGSLCPRARLLSRGVGGLRVGRLPRPTPGFLRDGNIRRALCGIMMFTVIFSVSRHWGFPNAIGVFFWGLCLVTLALAVALGLFFKPRSWCAVCPLGTLQDTLRGR